MASIESKIESILFSVGEVVETKKLKDFLKSSNQELEKALENLKLRYNKDNSGLNIVIGSDWVGLACNPNNSYLVDRFLGREQSIEKLTPSLLEVLSIVAYRGPINQIMVDYIRGANSSFALRGLMEKGLVLRESSDQDRSYSYQVTPLFFELTGITSLEDLPDYSRLKDKK